MHESHELHTNYTRNEGETNMFYRTLRIRGKRLRRGTGKAISVLLILMMLISVLTFMPVLADSGTVYELSIVRTDGTELDGNPPVYVGETAFFRIHIDLSGLNTTDMLIDPVLVLSYATGDISAKPVINASELPELLTAAPKAVDNSAQTITWTLTDLKGGTKIELPGNVSMPRELTPLNYPLELEVVLYADDLEGNPRTPVSCSLVIEWLYDRKVPAKTVLKDDYISTLPNLDGAVKSFLVYAGEDADLNGYIDADKTFPVTFTFQSTAPGSGSRAIEKIEVVDTLPDGAQFLPGDNIMAADNGGVGWTVLDDNTVKYSGPEDLCVLNLRFPNGKVRSDVHPETNIDYVNSAQYTYYISDPKFDDYEPAEYTYTISAGVQLSGNEVPGSIFEKTPIRTKSGANLSAASGHAGRLSIDEEIEGDYWFWNKYSNTMKATNLSNVMISDDTLDERLRFFAFTLGAQPGAIIGDAVVQYRVEGTEEWIDFVTVRQSASVLEGDFNYSVRPDSQLGNRSEFISGALHAGCDYTQFYFLPQGVVIDGLRLLISGMAPKSTVFFDTGAVLKDGEAAKIPRDNTTILSNKTRFGYEYDIETGTAKVNGDAHAYHDIFPYQPKFRGMKVVSGQKVVYSGSTFTVSNRLRFYDFNIDDTIDFNGAQIIDLLPQGMQYVPGSMVFSNINGQTLKDHYANTEPVIVYDYRGTGMTALIWNLEGEVDVSYFKGEYTSYYSYKVDVLESCEYGSNILYGYFHWPEYNKILATTNNQSATGVYKGYVPFTDDDDFLRDINNNGLTTEKFLKCELTLDYEPPAAVVAIKGVMGSYNSSYLYAPALGYSQAGDDSSFKLDIMNYSEEELDKLSIFDVLPYAGDVALVTNRDGVYVPRGTQFDVRLRGPLVIANDMSGMFEVLYCTADPAPWKGIDDYRESAGPGKWLTEAQVNGNWDAVRAFEIILKPGNVFRMGARVTVTLPVVMPDVGWFMDTRGYASEEDAIIAMKGEVAYNSYAIDSDGSYLEAIKAGIEIIAYDVAIKKTSDKRIYNAGNNVIYTLNVSNSEKTGVTGVAVTDFIPEELVFLSCDWPYTYDETSRKLTVTVGSLSALKSVAIKITCRAETANDVVINSASVTILEKELTLSNNQDDCEIRILPATGSLIIEKTLDGLYTDWSVDKETVFKAMVYDLSADPVNYLIFRSAPEPDGSYWCVGNNTALSMEELEHLTPEQIQERVDNGIYIDKVPFTVNKHAVLSNLWADCKYKVTEVFDDGKPVHESKEDAGATGEYYWAKYAGNSAVLAENGTMVVSVTNEFVHGEANLIISKLVDGKPADWNVSAFTTFYVQVFDTTFEGAMPEESGDEEEAGPQEAELLLFERVGETNTYWCVGNINRLSKDGPLGKYDDTFRDMSKEEIAELIANGDILDRLPFSMSRTVIVENLWISLENDLPLSYRIKEVCRDTDDLPDGADVSYTGNETDGYNGFIFEPGEQAEDGHIKINNYILQVANTYRPGKGTLKVSKKLEGSYEAWGKSIGGTYLVKVRNADTGKLMSFSESAPDYTYAGENEVGTAVEFSQLVPAVLKGIPAGARYTVEEVGGNEYDYYNVTYDYKGGVRTIINDAIRTAGDVNEVTVINTYEPKLAVVEIEFEKSVIDSTGRNKAFTFVLTEVTGPGGAVEKPGGRSEIKTSISGGKHSFILKGLEPGTYYYVICEESELPANGWLFDTNRLIVEVIVKAGESESVTVNYLTDRKFTNEYLHPLYPYIVNYYKDEVIDDSEHYLGTTDGVTEFEPGHVVDSNDVDDDLGEHDGWLNILKPKGYHDGELVHYTIITTEREENIVVVLYITDQTTEPPEDPDDTEDETETPDPAPPSESPSEPTPPTQPPGTQTPPPSETPSVTPSETPSDTPPGPGESEPPGGPEQSPPPEETQSSQPPLEPPPNPPPYEPGGRDRTVPPLPVKTGSAVIPGDDEDTFIEYDEEGVPLGVWHWDNDEEQWIFDEFAPPLGEFDSAEGTPENLPQTGKQRIHVYLMLLTGVALAGLGTAIAVRKSRKAKYYR